MLSRVLLFIGRLSLTFAVLLVILPVQADEPSLSPTPKVKIDWIEGPVTAKLGEIAQIKIPAGFRFTGKQGTRKFLELTQNPPNGNELGTIIPLALSDGGKDEFYFVIFEFNEVGYIKDDDRDKLDADALLKSIQENTEESNKERAKHGWAAYHVGSWYKPPFYDTSTRNLTWAIQGFSAIQGKPENSVNYSIRFLGRRGTMNIDLVLDPPLVGSVLPKFNALLSGFSFLPGSSYTEFRAGDKIAEYGLATLVAGGATAIAAKTGLLAKLWKLIIALFAGLLAFLKRAWNYFKRVLSGKASDETPQHG
ncbi:MAG: hypothetical protein NVS9B4_20270 [Candidatus Acidiferrum sp.]